MNKTGENIRKLRVLHSFSQEHMATKLGMSQGNYARMESGEGGISEKRLGQIALILGCSTEFILHFDPEKLVQHATPERKNDRLLHFNISAELKELYESRIQILETQLAYLKSKMNIAPGQGAAEYDNGAANSAEIPGELPAQEITITDKPNQTLNTAKAQIFNGEAQLI